VDDDVASVVAKSQNSYITKSRKNKNKNNGYKILACLICINNRIFQIRYITITYEWIKP
jgi:hypothetical protein